MNIKQLKEYIKDLPDEALVLRYWEKWWYDTLIEPQEITVYHNPDAFWSFWRYDDIKDWETPIKSYLF